MRQFIFFPFFLILSTLSAQTKTDSASTKDYTEAQNELNNLKSNSKPLTDTIGPDEKISYELIRRMAGVRLVNMYVSEEYVNAITNNQTAIDVQLLIGFMTYLREDLNYTVAFTKTQLDELMKMAKSRCEIVNVGFSGEFDSDLAAVGTIENIQAIFNFCDGSTFYLQVPSYGVNGWTKHNKKIQRKFRERIPVRIPYDTTRTLSLPTLDLTMSEKAIIDSIQSDTLSSSIEGVYQFFSGSDTHLEKAAIIKHQGALKLVYLTGKDYFENDWVEGEVKGKLIPTSSKKDFLLEFYNAAKKAEKGSISFDDNAFTINSKDESFRYVRIAP